MTYLLNGAYQQLSLERKTMLYICGLRLDEVPDGLGADDLR